MSEKETLVLLKVATIKQIPEEIFLLPLAFLTFTCSMFAPSKSSAVSSFFFLLLELLNHYPKTFFRPSPDHLLIPSSSFENFFLQVWILFPWLSFEAWSLPSPRSLESLASDEAGFSSSDTASGCVSEGKSCFSSSLFSSSLIKKSYDLRTTPTVLRPPLRVRALVMVRCPRTGKPR